MTFVHKSRLSSLVIILFAIVVTLVNFNHHKYAKPEGVIEWDIKSYYAYLPATFIYKDISLEFLEERDDLKKWIWPLDTPIGKKSIITTMGLSFLYAPFFFLAHIIAKISPSYLADGYSYPYQVAVQFSALVYFLLALFFLGKILRRYYSDRVTALTLLAVGLGTNLFFYVTYSAPMAHGYNFFLIVLFIYFLEKWTDKISYRHTIYLGLISGLVTLIRPTNILVLVLIPLWHVGSWKDLMERIGVLFGAWKHVVLMAFVFVLVWTPQFIYWKHVAGEFFYFSYGERGDRFYFANPQIWSVLFSYEKGWFVYTPMMFLAILGIFGLKSKGSKLGLPIIVYVALMVYVLSSWWCWWYGGSFGQRSMVDFYGLMAIPLAALIEGGWYKRFLKWLTPLFVAAFIALNLFNIIQFNNMAISYWWTNKEGYWENFLKPSPTCKYWNIVVHPDYEKARLGIYETVAPYDKAKVVTDEMLTERIIRDNGGNQALLDTLRKATPMAADSTLLTNFAHLLVKERLAESYFKKIKVDMYVGEINRCPSWKKEMEKKAEKRDLDLNHMIRIEAERIYKHYSQRYDQR